MKRTLTTLLLLLSALTCGAATRYVAQDGSGTAPYDTWAKAATGVYQVIAGSAAGDTILVTNGTYTKWPATWVTSLVWRSVNGPDVTIIDGGPNPAVLGEILAGDFYGFTFTRQTNQYGWLFEGSHVISNCVFHGNRNTRDNNPAVGFYGGKTSVVYNCNVYNNSSQYEGGGIGTSGEGSGGYITLINCGVSNNVAGQDGGGIVNLSGNLTMLGGTISRNQGVNGSAAYAVFNYGTILSNVLVEYNVATSTDGGAFRSSDVFKLRVYNSLIKGNVSHGIISVLYGGCLYSCTIVGNCASGSNYGATYAPSENINNCIIWGNYPTDLAKGLYSNCLYKTFGTGEGGPSLIAGNISNAPSFAGTWDDAFVPSLTNTGSSVPDVTLADVQLADGSPCINTGSNELWMASAADFSQTNSRIQGASVDIGAFEWLAGAASVIEDTAAEAMQIWWRAIR